MSPPLPWCSCCMPPCDSVVAAILTSPDKLTIFDADAVPRQVVVMADGQVTQGNQIMKPNVRKTRRIGDNVIGGFAGGALTLDPSFIPSFP